MIHTLMMSPQEKHVTWCDERIFWQPHFQNPEYNGDIDASCWNYCPEEEGIKTLVNAVLAVEERWNYCPEEEGIKTFSTFSGR